jgi:prepilin-type processing-associated H-X9-DG protein
MTDEAAMNDPSKKDPAPAALAMVWFTLGSFACVVFLLCITRCGARAREMAQRTQCSANMKAITTALAVRGNTECLSARQLICPSSGKPYIFRPPIRPIDARDVLIYESQNNHGAQAGGNVAYGDGHVVWRTPQQLEADLWSTNDRPGAIATSSNR